MQSERSRTHVVSKSRPTRALVPLFVFVAQCSAIVGCAYLFFGRNDLPWFFPHPAVSSKQPDARDVPMALIAFGFAVLAGYGAYYAKRHRSWLRSARWHRKHGRI